MKKRHVALLALVGLVAVPTIASAAQGANANNTIYGCINNRSGALRVVADPGQCSNSETAISWDRQGGLACWDTDGDGIGDRPAEDANNDGAVDVNDCRGPAGADGAPGAPGAPGADGSDGISCWDLDANGAADQAEDIDGDGDVDAADCRGPAGASGSDGTNGTDGVNCWDLNDNGTGDTPAEDTNGNGVVDAADCRGSGALFASVDGSGVLVSGNAVSATRIGTGHVVVTFARPITGCAATASPGSGANGGTSSLIAVGNVSVGFSNPSEARVRFNKPDPLQTAAPADTAFHLVVNC